MSAKYTVVLSSANRVNGSSVAVAKYNFNWSALPQGKYNMSFTFFSQFGTLTIGNEILLVQLKDLGVVIPSYTAGTSTSAINNGFVGVTSAWSNGANNYLQSYYKANPSITIDHAPTSNQFTVSLFQLDGITPSTLAVNYVMTLIFEPCHDKEYNEKN